MKHLFGVIRFFTFFVFASPFFLQAQEASTSCYPFAMPESPENSPMTTLRTEIWCYQKVSSPQGALFVYNADGDEVKPELAFLVEPDGLMIHGSLLAGERSVHKVHANRFNPFSVTIKEPQSVTALSQLEFPHLSASAQSVLNYFLTEPSEYSEISLEEGEIEADAADVLPWRGYWWPWKGQPLSANSQSPLAKYDRFVKAREGASPRAQAWESAYHKYRGVWWHGHCNGWAASAVLRKQPRHSVKDPESGVVFSVVDQKGILAEADYCANVAFFGKRYRGNSGDDIKDIYPAQFHRVLTYYVGSLKKPVALDYYRTVTVDNHVISGYKLTTVKTAPHTFKVKAVLKVHKYDGNRSNQPGTARSYTRTYRYTLKEDGSGNLIGGSWLSTNPDFLWVPLSPQDCGSNNPRLSHARVEEILALPAR